MTTVIIASASLIALIAAAEIRNRLILRAERKAAAERRAQEAAEEAAFRIQTRESITHLRALARALDNAR